jgi:glycosyltransferase involved in cell wall biosynthesis
VPFFEALRSELATLGCTLRLAVGEATPQELEKNDTGHLDWAIPLPTRYFWDGRICWQPFANALGAADLVVVTHENKLLYNLVAQFVYRHRRVALWGHGANLQGDASSLREKFKKLTARQADWWFAYTEMSLPLLTQAGYPRARVTVLNNAVDTQSMAAMRDQVEVSSLQGLRARLKLSDRLVGISVGSLYTEKRVAFMLEAADRIHQALPDFAFLIVGSGPQQKLVEVFCRENDWAHYLGAITGQAKVDLLAISDIMLNPGLVGLGILDAFVCQVPMVTTNCGMHSPEIAYLVNGKNGVMTANTMDAYVAQTIALLRDPPALARLRAGCATSAQLYTIENMARNFAAGVMTCINLPKIR